LLNFASNEIKKVKLFDFVIFIYYQLGIVIMLFKIIYLDFFNLKKLLLLLYLIYLIIPKTSNGVY
jgi:hypothetical protein